MTRHDVELLEVAMRFSNHKRDGLSEEQFWWLTERYLDAEVRALRERGKAK